METVVSIIIPTYNRAHLIGPTLESVLCQTYKNFECFVIDDGSNDNTENIIELIANGDNRIKYLKRPDERPKGASSCRNFGLENARGIYIQFLDSDDIISIDKLFNQVELLEKNSLNSFVTCKWGTFSSKIDQANIHESLKAYNNFENPLDFINAMGESICYFPPHAYLIRKSVIEKAGYWNEYLSLNDDGEFMMRVIINSQRICFSKDSVAFYRLPGKDNLSTFNDKQRVKEAIYSWELIENYLKIRFKQEEFNFIKRAKWDFYQHAKVFPDLIRENKFFFRDQLIRDKNWIKRLLYFK